MQGVIKVLHRIFLNPLRTVTYTQDISENFLLSISNQFIDTTVKNILLFLRAHTEVRASNFRICKSYSKPILVLYLLSVSCLLVLHWNHLLSWWHISPRKHLLLSAVTGPLEGGKDLAALSAWIGDRDVSSSLLVFGTLHPGTCCILKEETEASTTHKSLK